MKIIENTTIHNYNNLFDYTLKSSSKRKNTIQIKVIDAIVYVHTPLKFNFNFILKMLEKNKNFILIKIDCQKKYKNKMLYFGNEYNILVFDNKLLKKTIIEIRDNNFLIYKPINYKISLENIIIEWKKQKCYDYISEKIKFFISQYKFNFDINKNKITIKSHKTKWGSCSSLKNLNFNYKIIEKKTDIVDYLIIHELSHTIFMNHSKDFWNYVKNIIPDYHKLQKQLDL